MCLVCTWKMLKENMQNSLQKTLKKTTENWGILMVSDSKWETEKNKNDNTYSMYIYENILITEGCI